LAAQVLNKPFNLQLFNDCKAIIQQSRRLIQLFNEAKPHSTELKAQLNDA